MSVVFDFNVPHNDDIPAFPMLFPVDLMMKKREMLMDVFCLSSFVFTTKVEFSERCV